MRIGTHHGKFHADEVFAIAMLRQLDPSAQVIRSRDTTQLNTCDIVVDVGRSQYDHHTTEKTLRDNKIPYASAGLVWRDFGQQVIERVAGSESIEGLVQVIDEKLIQAIDANDNGIDLDRDARLKTTAELIGLFNPPWNSAEGENAAFEEAVSFAEKILCRFIIMERAKRQAIDVVKDAFLARPRKELLALDTFCPWTESLSELDAAQEVLFVVFPDKTGQFRLQVVPKQFGSFEARKALPEDWAGKENEELQRVTGIFDAVFCHPAKFIAGAKSHASIMKMANLAIES